MKANPRNFQELAQAEVLNREQIEFLTRAGETYNYLCDTTMGSYGDYEEQEKAKDLVGEIRLNSINNLAELLERFEANAVLNGIEVLWAENGDEACKMVRQIIEEHDVKVITKGKSMITEEIELNDYITARTAAKVYEGNLGEFLVQMRGTPPFNIVEPAINLKLDEIINILHENIDMPITENAFEIANYVREFLRNQFKQADMGITGVNQAIASTGSLLLVENEGNIRWSTSAPRIHVALMSIEKVCENLADALYLNGLLMRNSTGQAITSYVSLLNGPRLGKEKDGPEKVYVIILDNGRTKAYADAELREALRCIRCGRCSMKCPVYLAVGGYPYGICYPGPMGVALMPLLLGMDETKHLYEACTLCGACMEVCPAKVPHLTLFDRYRQMRAVGNKEYKASTSAGNKIFYKSFARTISNRRFFDRALIVARNYTKGSVENGYIKKLAGPFSGWFVCRDLPAVPTASFKDYWEKEGHKLVKEGQKDE